MSVKEFGAGVIRAYAAPGAGRVRRNSAAPAGGSVGPERCWRSTMDDWRDWLVLSVVLVVLGGLGWLGWITWVHARGADACLARGYPEVRLDHWGTVYCVKTVNGTTVVVPLQEAR